MQYRADIDGLRAIAVLSVMVFHYGASAVSGGFVGVDVFFVISGFLITRNLHSEISATGLSLVAFYNRRIRRIVPALLAVLLASMAAGVFFLMPGDYEALGESAAWASIGAGNIFFFLNTGYFDREASLQPLLHTWSLGVEEQFYLAWPILLALILKTRRPVLMIVLAIATSFGFSLHAMATDPKAAFYLPHFRAWELAVGALLTFTPSIRSRIISEAAGPIGLALIGYSMFFLTTDSLFPGLNAVPAVLGSALVLAPKTANATDRILSVPPMRFVGLISYSLYLWHWPVLVYYRQYNSGEMPGPLEAAALAGLSFVLATLSWRFVEQPLRRIRWRPQRLIGAGISSIAATAIAGAFIVQTHGLETRLTGNARAMSSLEEMWKWDCRTKMLPEFGINYCTFGADWDTAKSKALIWGDSHSQHMAPMIEAADRDPDMSFLLVNPCPAALGGSVYRERTDTPNFRERCQMLRQQGFDLLRADQDISLVIMASSWISLPTEITQDGSLPASSTGLDLLRIGLEEFIDGSQAKGRRYILLGQAPSTEVDPVPCLLSSSAHVLRRNCEDVGPSMWRRSRSLYPPVDAVLEAVAGKYGNVTLLLPVNALCKDETCTTIIDGQPLYRDAGHLRRNLPIEVRAEYARRIGLTRDVLVR